MTTQMTSRYGLTFVVAIAMTAAVVVAGSVWAKGSSQPISTDGARMDITAMMMAADVAVMPDLVVDQPF